ncbi:MAG TPA: UDP-N-acetylglucosamine--N-acetylmuramyl-(pentapeptide) pyrophosphoryl-undecaprenol N-acetylglucosamine transferase [Acidimicrobiales bacterium]|nr:UDP-N-acetylglucosamine--N-acetylmuramyl-(pentapeptide) pyrophosphoryl-undecaprenol N-acetylglucosamine transferase [Acidimicrobiales bacterium]
MTVRRYALVAGGGTAGHLQPALAIAEALVDRGHPGATIEFVGSSRGQDRAVLEGRGFPFTLLPGRGIVRSLSPADLVRNLGALVGLTVGCLRALALVWRARPAVVVSVGGYASLPASLSAVVLGVPLVLVNVDAVPGAANRLLGPFARSSAVGWEGTPLPRAVVTGTPVRPEIAGVTRSPDDRRSARSALGLPPDRLTIAAFGGSLGARRINQAIASLADLWSELGDRTIYHVVGRRDWDESVEGDGTGRLAGEPAGLHYRRVAYEDRMPLVYAAADIVVCRAGAMTVAELAVVGVPAILVPLPGAPSDNQSANARVLERVGAAVLMPDPGCDGHRLSRVLAPLLGDPARLEAMGKAAHALGRADAAQAGAAVVEASARASRIPGDPGGTETATPGDPGGTEAAS